MSLQNPVLSCESQRDLRAPGGEPEMAARVRSQVSSVLWVLQAEAKRRCVWAEQSCPRREQGPGTDREGAGPPWSPLAFLPKCRAQV